MAKFPKPPTSQKSMKGKPSGPSPGKKSAQHGDNSKLGMKASRGKGGAEKELKNK